ncbi:MAG: MBL fold metallo-hydrolase [Syntrophorhabdaceae bacterium]|nr:MBL fold metallo-hydrolase [Syntrophorhabdaceae bacterium]
MKVHFWGTKGSLPSSSVAEEIHRKIFFALKESRPYSLDSDSDVEAFIDKHLPFYIKGSYGTNTSCIEIIGGTEYVLCDAGTGIRDFGNNLIKKKTAKNDRQPDIFHIFISHLHWDHIHGFPFFTPAYIPDNRIKIYGFHKNIKEAFKTQQSQPFFPVAFKHMRADIDFEILESNRGYHIAGLNVKGFKQDHPGDSYGFRFEKDGKAIVYSSDCEHRVGHERDDYVFLDFFRDADLLIFDTQYSLLDAIYTKENWGHSNNIIAVELSVKAGVKRLCMFHNEPTCNDESLWRFLEDTRRYLSIYDASYPLAIDLTYDGMEIEV